MGEHNSTHEDRHTLADETAAPTDGERRPSRRRFLGGIGAAGVAAVAAPSVALAQDRRAPRPPGGRGRGRDGGGNGDRAERGGGRGDRPNRAVTAAPDGPGRFTRMWPDLQPLGQASPGMLEALADIGRRR